VTSTDGQTDRWAALGIVPRDKCVVRITVPKVIYFCLFIHGLHLLHFPRLPQCPILVEPSTNDTRFYTQVGHSATYTQAQNFRKGLYPFGDERNEGLHCVHEVLYTGWLLVAELASAVTAVTKAVFCQQNGYKGEHEQLTPHMLVSLPWLQNGPVESILARKMSVQQDSFIRNYVFT
jgi:hypothetical protein